MRLLLLLVRLLVPVCWSVPLAVWGARVSAACPAHSTVLRRAGAGAGVRWAQ
jgi:hypothetical protein